MGLDSVGHHHDETYSDTIHHADSALLVAKRLGRNRFEKASRATSAD